MEKEVKIKDKNLSLALTKALIENGSKDITDFENTNNIFSKNELSEITKLDLKNTGIKSLDGLEYCTNLTSLSISSPNIDEIRSEEDLEVYLEQKNNIKDYSLIEKLELLESLTIRNESLKELNLASLNKITELELEGNTELLDIKGLNELDQIKKLVILEKSLQRELDLDLILESDTLTELVFDVDMYPLLVEKYPDLKEKLEESNEKGLITSFQMKRLGLETQEKSIEELEAKDKKTDYILSNIIDPSYNEIERVAAVYTFLTKQEIYNIESKDLNTENETSKQEQFSEYEDIEEYPYLMSELLRKAGVKTKVIPSSMDKDSNALDFTEAHEVVRAYIDNEWYYFDPIKDGEKKEFKHFYKTRDEFSETHSISDNENDIRSPEEKRYNNFELSGVIGKVSSDIERKDEGPRLKDGRIAEVGAKGKNTQDINTDKIEQKKSDTDKDTNNLDSKDKPIGEYTVETLDEFKSRKERIIKQIKDMAKSLGIDIQDLNESMKGIEQAQNAIELETRKKEAKDEIEAEDEKQKDDKEQEEDGHDQGRIL